MKTLINDAFENDPGRIIEWAYGGQPFTEFIHFLMKGQRTGQAFMNVLFAYDPDEYKRLSGSLVDPFYDDSNIPDAIDKLTSK